MMTYEAAEIMVPMGDRVVVVDDGAGRMWRFTDGELGLGSVEYSPSAGSGSPPPAGAIEAAKKCIEEGGIGAAGRPGGCM